MMEKIRNWVISKIFIDGFKHIEKQNFMLKALDACYKRKELKTVWGAFTDSVIGLLEDAIDETKQAKKWG